MIQRSWKWSMKSVSLQHRMPEASARLVFSKKRSDLAPSVVLDWPQQHTKTLPSPVLHQSHPEPRQPEKRVTPVAFPISPLPCWQLSELMLGYNIPQQQAQPAALKGKTPVDLRKRRIRTCGFSFYCECLQMSLVIVTLFVHVLVLRLAV